MDNKRLIHMIWYQGKDKIPEKYVSTIACLRELNFDWIIKISDSTDIEYLINKYNFTDVYEKMIHMHQRIDFGRYLLLYEYGGLSMDMDICVIRPLRVLGALWNTDKLVVSRINLDLIEQLAYNTICGNINNAIIYAREPRHPVLSDLIDTVCSTMEKPMKGDNPFNDVLYTTGPCTFSKVVNSPSNKENVLILKPEYFEPITVTNKCIKRPDLAVVVHDHAMSWVPSSTQGWLGVYLSIKKFGLFILMFLLIVFIIFIVIKCNRNTCNVSSRKRR